MANTAFNRLDHGGNFSSLGPRTVFTLNPRAKKALQSLFLKKNSQFVLCLTILIPKLQIIIVLVYAQI
jgi:hypothetical protein